MLGQMMQQPLLISSLIVHAERHHADREIVSRRVEGDIHRTTYKEVASRSRRVAKALAALGVRVHKHDRVRPGLNRMVQLCRQPRCLGGCRTPSDLPGSARMGAQCTGLVSGGQIFAQCEGTRCGAPDGRRRAACPRDGRFHGRPQRSGFRLAVAPTRSQAGAGGWRHRRPKQLSAGAARGRPVDAGVLSVAYRRKHAKIHRRGCL